MTGRSLRAAPVLVVILLVMLAPAVALAARLWTLSASPLTITAGVQTAVALTVRNVGSDSGGDEITCVTIDVPTSFSIASITIVSVKGETFAAVHGWEWMTSSGSGYTRITFKNPADSNPLVGLPSGDQAVFSVAGTSSTTGPMTWTGGAFDKPGHVGDPVCGSGTFPALAVSLIVTSASAVIPTPSLSLPSPIPTPIATLSVAPTPRPTVAPTPRTTPVPSPAAPTDAPSSSPTTEPSSPSSQARPTPGGTNAPSPSPTDGPELARQIVVGGTGGGAGSEPSVNGIDGAVTALFGRLDLGTWTIPAVAMGVPGLLVIIVVLVQLAAGAAWVPVARRSLAGVGIRRRRSRPSRHSG